MWYSSEDLDCCGLPGYDDEETDISSGISSLFIHAYAAEIHIVVLELMDQLGYLLSSISSCFQYSDTCNVQLTGVMRLPLSPNDF